MTPRPGPALTFRSAALGYGRRRVLEGIDGSVAAGELLALVGPNGAGKSTLLRGIVGDAALLGGSIDRGDLRRHDIAYLPQGPEIDRGFPITVEDFATLGLWPAVGAWRGIDRAERDRVREALDRVGLASAKDRPIGALSGGQMQRLLFARTFLQDARLILLDEPFTGIDAATTAELIGLLQEWRRAGRTVIAALHDLAQVRAEFPRTLVLDGRPVGWGPTDEVLGADRTAPLCHHGHEPIGRRDPAIADVGQPRP